MLLLHPDMSKLLGVNDSDLPLNITTALINIDDTFGLNTNMRSDT